MPRKIKENNSPHFQFDKDVVCKAFSDILSREYGRKVVFTLVEKEKQGESISSTSTV